MILNKENDKAAFPVNKFNELLFMLKHTTDETKT